MSAASPDPTPAPLPLRHRNPPINPSGKPARASLVTLAIVGVGYLVSLVAPSMVVSPSQPTAPLSRVVIAFALTVLGVAISFIAGLVAFRRDRNWAWLIITGVPAVSLIAGGAILAATKVIT